MISIFEIGAFVGWLVIWVVITIANRDSMMIIKRGLPNMILFSFSVLGLTLANIISFDFLGIEVPCYINLYLNYLSMVLFFYSYFVRGIALIFEKHVLMLVALSVDLERTNEYLNNLSMIEKILLKHKQLLRKLKHSTKSNSQAIHDHLDEQVFHKPKSMLKHVLYSGGISLLIATVLMLTAIEKFKEFSCYPYQYLPLYVFLAIIMLTSYVILVSLRKSHDPFYLKTEYALVLGGVVPIALITDVVCICLFGVYYVGTLIFLVFIYSSHFISVLMPNIAVVVGKRRANFKRTVSIAKEFRDSDVRERAAERFCSELAYFKEDYEGLQLLTENLDIENARANMFDKYFQRNAPQELNITDDLKRRVILVFEINEDFAILTEVYREVKTMLYQNIALDRIH